MYVARLSLASLTGKINVAEMSSDVAAKLWDDTINKRLFDLIHSQTSVESLGGLLAIGA